MKKKLTVFISLIICSLAALLALPACDTKNNDYAELQYGKKYIYEDVIREYGEECYYVFYSNGTGIRRYFHTNGKSYSDYTLTFKYTYVDDDKEAVVCFFDSVEYGATNTYNVSNDWSVLMTVSKNVLFSTGGSMYINEDYLEEIPNFKS